MQCSLVGSVICLHLGAICVFGSGLHHTGAHICGNANTCLTYEGAESQEGPKSKGLESKTSNTAAEFLKGPSGLYTRVEVGLSEFVFLEDFCVFVYE